MLKSAAAAALAAAVADSDTCDTCAGAATAADVDPPRRCAAGAAATSAKGTEAAVYRKILSHTIVTSSLDVKGVPSGRPVLHSWPNVKRRPLYSASVV